MLSVFSHPVYTLRHTYTQTHTGTNRHAYE